jgi:hypothetical protein
MWEDNIELNLREKACEDRDCVALAQDNVRWQAFLMMVMFWIP